MFGLTALPWGTILKGVAIVAIGLTGLIGPYWYLNKARQESYDGGYKAGYAQATQEFQAFELEKQKQHDQQIIQERKAAEVYKAKASAATKYNLSLEKKLAELSQQNVELVGRQFDPTLVQLWRDATNGKSLQ